MSRCRGHRRAETDGSSPARGVTESAASAEVEQERTVVCLRKGDTARDAGFLERDYPARCGRDVGKAGIAMPPKFAQIPRPLFGEQRPGSSSAPIRRLLGVKIGHRSVEVRPPGRYRRSGPSRNRGRRWRRARGDAATAMRVAFSR